MSDSIEKFKYVELSYKIVDRDTGEVLTSVEFPLGYVHGVNQIMSEEVAAELEGRKAGETIEVPINGDQVYGQRDESLVFIDRIENVPEDYREVGMTITMENEKGEHRNFIVTRVDEKTVTVDGNNPLCGRWLVFTIEILSVRDATEDEIEAGGAPDPGPDLSGSGANETLQ